MPLSQAADQLVEGGQKRCDVRRAVPQDHIPDRSQSRARRGQETLRASSEGKGLTLTVTPCERELLVAADSERFQQILLNLITNAIKFTTTGGSIGVTCDGDASMVRVRVKDTGVGVRLLESVPPSR